MTDFSSPFLYPSTPRLDAFSAFGRQLPGDTSDQVPFDSRKIPSKAPANIEQHRRTQEMNRLIQDLLGRSQQQSFPPSVPPQTLPPPNQQDMPPFFNQTMPGQ